MRSQLSLCFVLCLASAVYAKEPKQYQHGTLVQMDSVPCAVAAKDVQSFAGKILGAHSGNKKTQEVLCQEYVLQSDTVTYRIRPLDEKDPVLLPVGDSAQFRLEKDRMRLRVEGLDRKERDYVVVSMTPRSAADTAEARPVRLNHLQ